MAFATAGVAQRVAARTLRTRERQARSEVRRLLDAALAVLAERGLDDLTVGEVLARAGLGTRAFYRHFASKDELLLALYAAETEAAAARRAAAVAAAPTGRAALEAWLDDALSLVFDRRRAARTRVLRAEFLRLASRHPGEFDRIVGSELGPLVAILERGRSDGTLPGADPQLDALTVYGLVWSLAAARLDGRSMTRRTARDQVLRYCLPALGATG